MNKLMCMPFVKSRDAHIGFFQEKKGMGQILICFNSHRVEEWWVQLEKWMDRTSIYAQNATELN